MALKYFSKDYLLISRGGHGTLLRRNLDEAPESRMEVSASNDEMCPLHMPLDGTC